MVGNVEFIRSFVGYCNCCWWLVRRLAGRFCPCPYLLLLLLLLLTTVISRVREKRNSFGLNIHLIKCNPPTLHMHAPIHADTHQHIDMYINPLTFIYASVNANIFLLCFGLFQPASINEMLKILLKFKMKIIFFFFCGLVVKEFANIGVFLLEVNTLISLADKSVELYKSIKEEVICGLVA